MYVSSVSTVKPKKLILAEGESKDDDIIYYKVFVVI